MIESDAALIRNTGAMIGNKGITMMSDATLIRNTGAMIGNKGNKGITIDSMADDVR